MSGEALCSIPITGTSSLLRLHPPPIGVSLLLTLRLVRLCRFDLHHQLASTVPYTSPYTIPAAFMPSANTGGLSLRQPLYLSRDRLSSPGF